MSRDPDGGWSDPGHSNSNRSAQPTRMIDLTFVVPNMDMFIKEFNKAMILAADNEAFTAVHRMKNPYAQDDRHLMRDIANFNAFIPKNRPNDKVSGFLNIDINGVKMKVYMIQKNPQWYPHNDAKEEERMVVFSLETHAGVGSRAGAGLGPTNDVNTFEFNRRNNAPVLHIIFYSKEDRTKFMKEYHKVKEYFIDERIKEYKGTKIKMEAELQNKFPDWWKITLSE